MKAGARVAVYTSITGSRDYLKEEQVFEGADFFAFLDEPVEGTTKWSIGSACSLFDDPVRNAKIHKVLAHEYLPNYDYSLWIDGSITLNVPVRDLIERFLGQADFAVFSHFARDCIYEEARVCRESGLDSASLIDSQVSSYRAQGYPAHAGLCELSILLRRHTAAVEAFNNAWWAEICRFSRRDQLSFNFVVRQLGLPLALLPQNLRVSPLFTLHEHRRS